MAPAASTRPNFDPDIPDENEGDAILIVTAIMTALIIISTVPRIVGKLWNRMRFGIEDYLIIIAFAMNLTGNAVEYEAVRLGFGRHLQYLSADQEWALKRWNQFGILFANLALWAIKLSICFFILALIRGAHRRAQWVVYALMFITCCAHGSQLILWSTQARPLRKLWTPNIDGTIASKRTLVTSILASTILSSIIDLFYALSPIYFFGSLQMSTKKKVIVIGLTGSGLLVFCASTIRVGAFVNDFFDPDFSYGLRRVYVCTIVERNLAEFVADLPAIFPLLRGLRNKAMTLITHTYGTSNSTSKSGSSTVVKTIGSEGKKHSRRSDFAAYGPHGQFTTIQDNESDDEILLQNVQRPNRVVTKDDGGITVEVNIDVKSQERKERPVWPAGGLRPEP